jgi:hypothetical protein
MDLPEVQAGSRLEATVPLGDAESLEQLRERTEQTVTRPAGSTALVDGDIPPANHPEPGQEPDGTPRADPCAQAVRAGDVAAAHSAGLA